MSDNQNPQFHIGDVANGHVLTEKGWVPVPQKKKHTGRNVVLGILGFFVVVGIIGAATGGGDESATAKDKSVSANAPTKKDKAKPESKPEPKDKPIAVSAKDILAEFEDNEAAADLKYDGKDIAVTGIVDKVDTEFWNDDEYVVQVGDGSDFVMWTVNCDDQSAETAAAITKGQRVTVTGDFEDGGDLGVEMHGCSIS